MKDKISKKTSEIIFIWQFAMDDFKAKYAGSALGGTWAFLQPIITIVLYWFVFQLGFKTQSVGDFPFILWLLSGLIPWFFFSDAISNATASMMEYNYLVKKVLFNVNILPLAKIVSSLLVHCVMILLTIIIYMFFGYWPNEYYLQIPMYVIYTVILVSGIVYITATLYVFFKDTIQIVSIVLQVIFWLTPIVWQFDVMPAVTRKILIFNPVYYIVNGYRTIFIYKQWIGQNAWMTVYYWVIALLLLIVGLRLFAKCREHFADVL
ncbi:MAG TPA: ABC transporter permease [Clostridiales bacterium]|nr:ABC transporter permease [Clostridiales bacterium]